MASNPARQVIFDLGGVVLRWNVDDILRGFYADETLRALAKREIFLHEDWLQIDCGTLEEEHAIVRFCERTNRPAAELQALMGAVRDSVVPMPESLELLHELAARGVPLYCLSNMPAATFDHLRRLYDIFDLFEGVVISAQIKLIKPDPRIFEYIARRYRLEPGETAFVDDMQANIAAAATLGFHTVLFRSAQQCREALAQLI
jgi:epoxide hydrolase-like predicted phosphatase